ncbi:MAG: TIM barrel protein [Acidilobaceae archaeon]
MARIRYGPAGLPIDYKGQLEGVPSYLRSLGLDAFEYEAVHGVKVKEEKARSLGSQARAFDVKVSIHGPYYINLASPERDVVLRSIERIVESLKAAEWMGAEAVVIHTGYYKGNPSKKIALERAIATYKEALDLLPSWVKTPTIAPETLGKDSQIGTVEEVVEICRQIERCKPCVDWAHIYARYEGKFVTKVDDVLKVIEFIEKELGSASIKPLHTHFSKIEYGKGGEREHKVLAEKGYGPDWSIVCEAYLSANVEAVVISESPLLDKDALVMKSVCEEIERSRAK